MTSEQQIKTMFGKENIFVYSLHYYNEGQQHYKVVVKAYLFENWYIIGLSHSRYKAFTDALKKLGGKVIYGSGNYQKNKL